MRSQNDQNDPHVDWSKLGKKTREQINAEAAREKAKLGLLGQRKRLTAHVKGSRYDVQMPNVRAIREQLKLTQQAFATRFHLSLRTVQQWEQQRASPDMPARILLKAIEQAPEIVAEAAASVERELTATRR
ncbi:MAG: helix-turn-helix domain-containing protein [Candidatus Eremiobacteraeota bacterium]|nr:helix-turn-helix domain-containing protein [Candidatus Eremiobacteraeota bacterium]